MLIFGSTNIRVLGLCTCDSHSSGMKRMDSEFCLYFRKWTRDRGGEKSHKFYRNYTKESKQPIQHTRPVKCECSYKCPNNLCDYVTGKAISTAGALKRVDC